MNEWMKKFYCPTMKQQANSDLWDSYKITYKVSEKDIAVLVHKEVKRGRRLEDERDPFLLQQVREPR